MERRQFLKSSCNFCLLAASGVLLSEMAACNPAYKVIKSEIVNNSVQMPLNLFSQSPIQFIRPSGWYYDIAVQKKEDHYEAMLMQCTHQNNQLIPTGNGFNCTLHGSQFNKDGIVTKGPAEKPLKKYSTTINQDQLVVHLNA